MNLYRKYKRMTNEQLQVARLAADDRLRLNTNFLVKASAAESIKIIQNELLKRLQGGR
jgi:hypothetical protein